MTWAFDVTSNIPRITQSGTDTSLDGIATAITAQATVARSTAYTTAQMVKPPTPTGFWYRCSTAGTTAATAPTYGTTDAGTTTDGTAVFTAFKAPDVQTLGTKNHYYMPAFRVNITGTLTNANPQISNFTCWDLYLSAAGTNFTSGTWASDGVTPLYDGVHFACVRSSANNADNVTMQLQIGSLTLIGGEVQLAGACSFAAGTTPRTYYTRWRGTKQWGGASSTRIRAYSANAIFRQCEFYDIAYDLFQMPAEFSAKARKCEYVAQYVGGYAGGVDAYFKASALENVDGSYDFDNYGGGYVELFNCAKGANLNVVTQLGTSLMCTPLYQDLVITAKNTSGVAVQNVRFTCTDAPTNSPTTVITTRSNLKTWDFRNPLSYQATTDATGVALSSPILHVWYFATTLKKNLRFPASTATYEGRAYNYKTMTIPIVLGSNTAQQVSAGMVGLDTATILSESAALALGKFTFTPSGATGGNVQATSSYNLNELWDVYRAWISQFANRASQDTWTCLAGSLNMGAWTFETMTGVTGSEGSTVKSLTSPTITNGGTMLHPYTTTTGPSARLTLEGPTDTSIRVSTNTGAEYDFASDIDATYVDYFAPGKTGTWTWIAERLGKQRQSGTFTPGVGGDFAKILIWLDDLGLTETNAAVLAAITNFANPNQVLNYAAYWRTTQAGIAINKISKDGNAVSWGDANVNWVASAAVPLAYDAATNTFTAVTTGHVAGSTLFSHRTTGLMTFGAGTNFNVAFKDVNGLRVSVTGLNPQGFTLTGHLRYRKNGTTTWTNTTYTGNTITLLMEEAIYDVQVRCPGYEWKTTEVDAAKTLLLDVGLQYQVSANNTPQYTMPFDAVLEAIFSYDPPSMQVAVANTTGGILQPGFAELYQATQRIMHLSGLVWTWTNPIKANATSQKIIIPTGNPLQMFLTAASNASVKLTCPVIHEDSGQSADDRVRGNATGYSIILGSPATAESAGLQAAIVADILAATLKANIVQVNNVTVTGTGEEGTEWGPAP